MPEGNKSKYLAPDSDMSMPAESTSVQNEEKSLLGIPQYLKDNSSVVVAPNGQIVTYLDKSVNKSKQPKPDPEPTPPKTLDHPYASLIEHGPMGADKFMEFKKLNDERRAKLTPKQRFDEDVAERKNQLNRHPENYNVIKDYVQKGINEPGLEQVYPVEETLFAMTLPGARAALASGESLLSVAAKESLSTLTGGASDIVGGAYKRYIQDVVSGYSKNMAKGIGEGTGKNIDVPVSPQLNPMAPSTLKLLNQRNKKYVNTDIGSSPDIKEVQRHLFEDKNVISDIESGKGTYILSSGVDGRVFNDIDMSGIYDPGFPLSRNIKNDFKKFTSNAGGQTDVPSFNNQIKKFKTNLEYGSQPIVGSNNLVTREDALLDEILNKFDPEIGFDFSKNAGVEPDKLLKRTVQRLLNNKHDEEMLRKAKRSGGAKYLSLDKFIQTDPRSIMNKINQAAPPGQYLHGKKLKLPGVYSPLSSSSDRLSTFRELVEDDFRELEDDFRSMNDKNYIRAITPGEVEKKALSKKYAEWLKSKKDYTGKDAFKTISPNKDGGPVGILDYI